MTHERLLKENRELGSREALHLLRYNFVPVHQALKVSPAIALELNGSIAYPRCHSLFKQLREICIGWFGASEEEASDVAAKRHGARLAADPTIFFNVLHG